ncbi:MAG TPA: hypothetical protein VL025_22645 [Thermoanaerobaculia bacterium]|nr:hypothetical protein [Thermoanaerobaculia bacterium]
MKACTAGIAAAWILCGATAGLAQSWTITIGSGNTIASTTLQQGRVNLVTQDTATVTVTCQSGVDCSQADLRITLGAATLADLGPPTQSAAGPVFTFPKSAVSNGTQLAVIFAGNPIGSFPVGPNAGGTGATASTGDSETGPTPTLAQLLALPCPGTYTVPGYDAKGNQGEVVVTPLGTILVSNLDTLFDENDTLVVRVVADKRLLSLLAVARTSAFRDVTSVQILGAGETAPSLLDRQTGLVLEADCGERRFLLDNFAPGRGQVQISALQGTQLTPTGSFDFNVNPLYTGMLTLGAARTQVVDPGYKLASVGGQTVVAAGEEGDDDLIYTLFYTPFLWGKRDVQKDIPWYQHVNLTVGVAPEDITDNAFAGVTADLPGGIALTYGVHFRRIEVLTQGLSVGDPFSGAADQLPTAQEWENDQFVAVSIDLRAMVQVLRAAMGTGGGS